MKRTLFILLISLFLSHLLFRIYEYRQDYLTPYNPDYWKQRYEHSQWGTKKVCENLDPHVNPYTCVWDDNWYEAHKNDKTVLDLKKTPIGDDAVYAHAGWEYIHGHDPTTLNAELPPFGKYLIGLSVVIFGNQNIFALFSALLALTGFYLVNKLVLKNAYLAFIPVFLLTLEPLFYTQIRAPFLDLLYLGLFLICMYFFLKKKYITSAVFLGLMAGTKSPASTFLLVICVFGLYLLILKQWKDVKQYVLSLSVAALSFLATYFQYFVQGNTILEFFGVQKWILNFYASGAKGTLTAPWEMIFTGKYNNWWGEQSIVTEWHIGWPLLLVLSGVAIYYVIKYQHKHILMLFGLWLAAYFLFLSFVPLWSRYLLLALPFMYTLVVYLFSQSHILNKMKKKK